MTIPVSIRRIVGFLALSQTLWLTTCEEESGRVVKLVTVTNIPDSFKVEPMVKDQLSQYYNPLIKFSQEGELKTDGLYIMVVFFELPSSRASDLQAYIMEIATKDDEIDVDTITENGKAFALMKIVGGTAEARILKMSPADERGNYWDPGATNVRYGVCTLLITPDARFVLKADFYLGSIHVVLTEVTCRGYSGTIPRYTLDFNNKSGLKLQDITAKLEETLPSGNEAKIFAFNDDDKFDDVQVLLSENFIMDLVDKFS
jgi:hypothetical protein